MTDPPTENAQETVHVCTCTCTIQSWRIHIYQAAERLDNIFSCSFSFFIVHVYVSISGAAEANFDWSSERGLVAGFLMGAELGKHVRYVRMHVLHQQLLVQRLLGLPDLFRRPCMLGVHKHTHLHVYESMEVQTLSIHST